MKLLIKNYAFYRHSINEGKKGILINMDIQEIIQKLEKNGQAKDEEINFLIKIMNDEEKIKLVKNFPNLGNDEYSSIVESLSIENLANFLINERESLEARGKTVEWITRWLSEEKQLEFVAKMDGFAFTEKQKKLIYATLSEGVKERIDKDKLPEEYRSTLSMKIIHIGRGNLIHSVGKIKCDFNIPMEEYRYLDEEIFINAAEVTEEEKAQLLKLCKVCPNMRISSEIVGTCSTEEYIEAEKWIEEVLQGIKPEWTDIQKVAYIDNTIGKRVSYSPDFGTEVFDHHSSRSPWKIVVSGYGVCNGISELEKYILGRIGIQSELIEAKKHVFLLLKDIEIPTDEGNVRGDTILDSTWNLPANRFGYLPRNFCKSYEEIRKQDIDRDGKDNESHKIDEKLSNITLNLDIKYEGEAMKSLGIVDEQGRFPLKWLLERLKDIKEGEFTQQQKLQKIFEEVEKYCPEFAKCQNETTQMLELLINGVVEIEFNRCIVNRVYAKNDEQKIPILFVYIDLPGEGRKFYIADKESGKFVEREQREFENEYDCYNTDKQKNNGHRFWENDIQDEKELKDGNSQNEEQR